MTGHIHAVLRPDDGLYYTVGPMDDRDGLCLVVRGADSRFLDLSLVLRASHMTPLSNAVEAWKKDAEELRKAREAQGVLPPESGKIPS